MPTGTVIHAPVVRFFILSIFFLHVAAGAYGDPGEEEVNRRVHREDETIFYDRHAQSQEANYNMYHSLQMQILQSYNRHVRPLAGEDKEVVCNFSMIVTHLDNVDEDHQTMELHGWVILQWYDDRLSWNSSTEFGTSIPKIVIPQQFIWRPDLHLYNNAESKVDTLVSANTLAHVYSDGKVVIDPPISLRAYCEFDYARYPWDKQTCTVALGSWAYRTHELKWSISPALANNPSTLYRDSHRLYGTNWRIDNVSLVLSELIFEAERWHYVNILFSLKREPLYALKFVIIPIIITMVLTVTAFLFTTTKKGLWKMILILSALILEIIHLLAIYSRLPTLVFNALPNSVVLCITNIVVTLLSLLIASFTTSLYERKDRVPSAIRIGLRHQLLQIICCHASDCEQLEIQQCEFSTQSPSRNRRHQNHRHAVLITNQLGVTKRMQPSYADDPDYPSRPSSSPSSPNESFRMPRPQENSGEGTRRRTSARSQDMGPWVTVSLIADRIVFLLLTIIYAILWIVLVVV